jgi:hypothetical protein
LSINSHRCTESDKKSTETIALIPAYQQGGLPLVRGKGAIFINPKCADFCIHFWLDNSRKGHYSFFRRQLDWLLTIKKCMTYELASGVPDFIGRAHLEVISSFRHQRVFFHSPIKMDDTLSSRAFFPVLYSFPYSWAIDGKNRERDEPF